MNAAARMVDTDPVPQLNPRQASAEDAVAQRIRHEREHRGWSTAQVARLMAEVGRPVNQTAIWKIENGTPRRTISLDEALALAQVFGLTLNELTQPPDEDFRAIRRLLTDLSEWNREEVNHREDMIELLARARTVLGAVDVGTLFDDSAAKATYEERASQMRELNHQLDLVKDALSIRLDLIESQGDADFVTLLPILPPVGPERPE